MKYKFKLYGILPPFIFLLTLFPISCSSIAFDAVSSRAWSGGESGTEFSPVRLCSVSVDKTSSRSSIEGEIRRMVPLLGLDYRRAISAGAANAEWVMDIWASEREFMSGWNTKYSLAVEVFIYPNAPDLDDGTPLDSPESRQKRIPFAAGRALFTGSRTLASSSKLEELLRAALKKALHAWQSAL